MLSTKVGVGDRRWHFLQAGNPSKPAIVLLHGWSMDCYAYEALGELLSKDFRVIIPDLPGFGLSSRMDEVSLEAFAHRLNGLFQELQIESAVLVGHSLGGAIAVAFAQKFPGQVRQLVLLDSTGIPIKRSALGWGIVALEKMLHSLRWPKGLIQVLRAFQLNLIRHPAWSYQTYRLTIGCDLITGMTKPTVPISIFWGENDEFYPDSQSLQTAFGVRALIVPGNHDWPILQPELANQIIQEVL